MQIKTRMFQHGRRRQVSHLQHRLIVWRSLCGTCWKKVPYRSADHMRNQLLVRRGAGWPACDTTTVAQHCETVSNASYFVEKLTDVDDTYIFFAKLTDEPEQMFYVGALQASRGLVHHNDLIASRDRAAHF